MGRGGTIKTPIRRDAGSIIGIEGLNVWNELFCFQKLVHNSINEGQMRALDVFLLLISVLRKRKGRGRYN